MLFSLTFIKGIKEKINDLESESDIFPQNEGKIGKYELTPVVKALTNCALTPIELHQTQLLQPAKKHISSIISPGLFQQLLFFLPF